MAGEEIISRVDASSLARGVFLENRGAILEDAYCLRPINNAQHINLAELDGTMKGINLALQWQVKMVHLYTDSACVYS